MKKWICMSDECRCRCEVGIMLDAMTPHKCPYISTNTPDWQEMNEPATATLPKLTAEVFDRPDCPEWANWAAITPHGSLLFFEKKPIITKNEINFENWKTGKRWYYDGWWCDDPSDWQNSLIERPAKLPGWCKVGEWVYHDSDGYYYTVKSIDIENDNIQIIDEESEYTYTANEIKTFFSQARLRPYNAEEMKALVGKVLEHEDKTSLVIACLGNGLIRAGVKWVSAERLIEEGYTLDGKPCGKLTHKEGDDWVE